MTLASIFLDPSGRLRAIWRAVTFVPIFLLLLILFSMAMALVVGPERLEQGLALALAVGGLGSMLVALLASWLLLRLLDRRDFRTLGLWFYPRWGGDLGLGFVGGLLLVSFVVGGQWVAGSIEFLGLAAGGSMPLHGAWWNLLVLLPAAAGEELVFRGYPFQRLVESVGAYRATSALAVLFGIAHLSNPSPTVLSTLNTSLVGVLLALTYLKTGGLWLPIGLHFTWNYALGVLYSLPVSGLRLEGVLWKVEVSGPVWLSGGAYGPEGSVVCSVIVLLAILFCLRWPRVEAGAGPPRAVQ